MMVLELIIESPFNKASIYLMASRGVDTTSTVFFSSFKASWWYLLKVDPAVLLINLPWILLVSYSINYSLL